MKELLKKWSRWRRKLIVYFPHLKKYLFVIREKARLRARFNKWSIWKAYLSPTAKDGWSMKMRVIEGGRREGGTRAQ